MAIVVAVEMFTEPGEKSLFSLPSYPYYDYVTYERKADCLQSLY